MARSTQSAQSQYNVLPPGAATSSRAAPLPKLAVFVTHGMGQQVPFATLDAVFERLRGLEPFASARPEAETVDLGGQQMQRIVLQLPSLGREIHFYEGYWAPLTEGEVTLRDVSLFLLRAGINGILNSSTSFSRWIFGRWQAFDIPVRTWAYLVVALATIGSLGLMNTVIVLVSAARASIDQVPSWLSDPLFCDLTTTLNLFLVIATVFGATVALARASRRTGLRWVRHALGVASIPLFALTLLACVLAGIALPLLILSHLQKGGGWTADVPRWSTLLGERRAAELNTWWSGIFLAIPLLAGAGALVSWGWKFLRAACAQILGRQPNQQPIASILVLGALTLGALAVGLEVSTLWPGTGESDNFHWPLRLMITWAAVLLLSGGVRRFLVQYLGDVTAYIDAHTVDRFADLRSRIKECVTDRARAVYGATGNDEYAGVVVVGHSLGSVVSFDVLNQLLCEDAIKRQAGGPGLDVARRTPLLLTFGSPLDKMAFIFAIQHRRTTQAREALVASAQPMLHDYDNRPRRWVNIYSPWDIISGSLEYFDLPGSPDPRHVENLKDAGATTLLMSHVEYWENDLLPALLAEALTAPIQGTHISPAVEA